MAPVITALSAVETLTVAASGGLSSPFALTVVAGAFVLVNGIVTVLLTWILSNHDASKRGKKKLAHDQVPSDSPGSDTGDSARSRSSRSDSPRQRDS